LRPKFSSQSPKELVVDTTDTPRAAAKSAKSAGESHAKAVERARDAIRKLTGNLEQSVGEMMGTASTYGDELAGHQSAIESGMDLHKDDDFGSVMLNQLATMQDANNSYRTQLNEANAQIAKQKEELESLQEEVFVDFLTKIPNRRSFELKFKEEAYRGKRYNQPVSLAFIDVDEFKHINDTHGHHIGDRVLRGIAMKMRSTLRQSDFLARHGGEEFAALLPTTTVGHARTVAEKLRKDLAHSIFRTDDIEIQVSVSIGVGEFQPEVEDFEKFLARVDRAMYKAKENGRNCIVKADPAPK
jgi:diguanylate cyclase